MGLVNGSQLADPLQHFLYFLLPSPHSAPPPPFPGFRSSLLRIIGAEAQEPLKGGQHLYAVWFSATFHSVCSACVCVRVPYQNVSDISWDPPLNIKLVAERRFCGEGLQSTFKM